MGITCSYIAVRGAAKEAVYGALQVEETARKGDPGGRVGALCGREMPGGWVVVYALDPDWASPDRMRLLSTLGPAVSCQFSEHVSMASTATGYLDGLEQWRVHDLKEEDLPGFAADGEPPPEWAPIRDAALAEQAAADAAGDPVDYLSEAPLVLVQNLCGFHPYELPEEMSFTVLRGPAGYASAPRPALSIGSIVKKWVLPLALLVLLLPPIVFAIWDILEPG